MKLNLHQIYNIYPGWSFQTVWRIMLSFFLIIHLKDGNSKVWKKYIKIPPIRYFLAIFMWSAPSWLESDWGPAAFRLNGIGPHGTKDAVVPEGAVPQLQVGGSTPWKTKHRNKRLHIHSTIILYIPFVKQNKTTILAAQSTDQIATWELQQGQNSLAVNLGEQGGEARLPPFLENAPQICGYKLIMPNLWSIFREVMESKRGTIWGSCFWWKPCLATEMALWWLLRLVKVLLLYVTWIILNLLEKTCKYVYILIYTYI